MTLHLSIAILTPSYLKKKLKIYMVDLSNIRNYNLYSQMAKRQNVKLIIIFMLGLINGLR